MLICRPVGIKLMADFSILLLLISFLNKWVLQEFGPGKALTWRLIQQALEEGLELGGHVVGELHWVLHDQVDQRVDTVSVEGRCTNKKLVDDDSKRPQVDGMVVGQLLDQLWGHIKWCTLDRGQYNRVCRHGARKTEIAKLYDTVG